jgi:S-adenosylmethionine:tRNA ribosyltransferase-isomerase
MTRRRLIETRFETSTTRRGMIKSQNVNSTTRRRPIGTRKRKITSRRRLIGPKKRAITVAKDTITVALSIHGDAHTPYDVALTGNWDALAGICDALTPKRLLQECDREAFRASLVAHGLNRVGPGYFCRVTQGDRTSDYDFNLPPERIAQRPLQRRDASRLMVVNRAAGSIAHGTFSDIAALIDPRDVLVVNRTRVLRARLLGKRASGAPAEILLLKPLGGGRYEAMVSPGGKLKPGRRVEIASELTAEILEVTERRTRVVRLESALPLDEAIERFGHVPLPPYIERSDVPEDAERYQTVFAREAGSVAAPTAGLHFTTELLDRLAQRGVARAEVLLHVGAGTFKPVEVDDPAQHVMHEEWYSVSDDTARMINERRTAGGRVWAVGTTSVRTLESAASQDGTVHAGESETRIFIRPPYRFRAVDRIITNFHLPRSTLIMLVAAFAGYELTMRAYAEAVARRYRFYSYGDAMVII